MNKNCAEVGRKSAMCPEKAESVVLAIFVDGVAGAADRPNYVSESVNVERFAQAADMHVDRPAFNKDFPAPGSVEKLLAGKYAARTLHQDP